LLAALSPHLCGISAIGPFSSPARLSPNRLTALTTVDRSLAALSFNRSTESPRAVVPDSRFRRLFASPAEEDLVLLHSSLVRTKNNSPVALHEKSLIGLLLCATSVFAVVVFAKQ
jgi:hypothetical protein